MKQVIVKGITKKGKDRVHQHGSFWFIIDNKEGRFLLQSCNTQYLKWGFLPDFEQIDGENYEGTNTNGNVNDDCIMWDS